MSKVLTKYEVVVWLDASDDDFSKICGLDCASTVCSFATMEEASRFLNDYNARFPSESGWDNTGWPTLKEGTPAMGPYTVDVITETYEEAMKGVLALRVDLGIDYEE